jgi:SsrA-binding protein
MVITKNKKAYWEYTILNEYVTGIVLVGSELKPLINNKVSLNESYCIVDNDEVFIKGMYISENNLVGKYDSHKPNRIRKLLLNKSEIKSIIKKINQKGMTLIPLNIHKNKTGLIKVKIALAKGKKLYDKKNVIKDRDTKRDLNRELKTNNK